MTTTQTPREARINAIAERLRERSDELSSMGCKIEETDEAGSEALQEAAQHLDDAAYILEELKLRCYIASLERTIGGITLLPVTGDPTATTTHPNVAPRRRYQ